MKKTDLTDVTFIMPLRLDSVDRIENTQMVVNYIHQHFDTHIYILEASRINNGILTSILPKNVQIEFVKDFDPIFHRTHYINVMTRRTDTKYCAIWDTDIIIPVEQVIQAVTILRESKADFVYPYIDLFLDVPKIIKEHYFESGDIRLLTTNTGKMKRLYQPNPVGGAFLVNRNSYLEAGMENENYYGWGREDGDRLNRWNILGYKVKRTSGALFHLSHERGVNSNYQDSMQDEIKYTELLHIFSMSKNELKAEITSWKNTK